MTRARVLLVATVVIALALAFVGVNLHATFADERALADAAALERERTLELLLGERMADTLSRRARAAAPRLAEAERDPLADASGLLLWRGGEQILPRPARFAAGGQRPAAELLAALRAGRPPAAADDATAARFALTDGVRRAREVGDGARTAQAVSSFIELRAQHTAPADVDVPTTLALLALADPTALDPRFVEAVLYRGLTVRGTPAPALARVLMDGRARLSRADFGALRAALADVARTAGVYRPELDAVAGALADDDAPPPPVGERPALVQLAPERRAWLVREGDVVRGVLLPTDEVLGEITRNLPPLLLPADATVSIAAAGDDPAAWVDVSSPSIDARRDAAVAAYRWKTGLLGGTASLLVLAIALALALVHRERRFLALRERFLRTISHELRTPLASLRLLAETLERRTEALPEARDYPRRIVQDVDGLSFLVENVLSFQRFDHGGIQARPQPVALRDAVADLEDQLAPLAPAGLTLLLELDAERVYADPEMLRLVLENLGRNACLYNEREPVRLTLRSRARDDGVVVIEVEDNGVGIPADERERVFEDFFRGRGTGAPARGSGLGLPLCREVMAAHGGAIRVLRSSDAGTCFELVFPREKEAS